ncbi:MAG: N(4)-(Beta-N-acetylglucosaminyl)-L-asparaginase precursor [Candidatus Hinthialibacteria bacterium OLB16]|nr:MAG: N(4)-(Beta-N-acetylglucosaminyl)-L-asparaginase precursor [Candidatus Hinthialibacteria bacterium OLB16]
MEPIVISTWKHGLAANQAAWEILSSGGSALDAAEGGVRVTESDPSVHSVGLGGARMRKGWCSWMPASWMPAPGRWVRWQPWRRSENPISVARRVMEATPHVLLAGKGAFDFALSQGFERTNLLTEEAFQTWLRWRRGETDTREISHDTIGLCALDSRGHLAVACTTSGLAWKLPGRVGDSPICGAGAFAEAHIGAACATGVGEEALRVAGSFLVVELMRNGYEPAMACREACRRIRQRSVRESLPSRPYG